MLLLTGITPRTLSAATASLLQPVAVGPTAALSQVQFDPPGSGPDILLFVTTDSVLIL